MRTEIFFIVGALEDAHFSEREKYGDYTIEIDQKNKEWLELLSQKLHKHFKKLPKIRKRKDGNYRLRLHSKAILEEVKDVVKFVHANIVEENTKAKVNFLRGIYDAEGSVHKERYSIVLSNKKEHLIELSRKMLNELGIKTGKVYIDKNGVRNLPIYGRENLIVFKKLVGFYHPKKRERLNYLIGP